MFAKLGTTSDKSHFPCYVIFLILAIVQVVHCRQTPSSLKNETDFRSEYLGSKLFRIYPNTTDQLTSLVNYIEEKELDAWNVPSLADPTIVLVDKDQENEAVEFLKKSAILYTVAVEDIESLASIQNSGLQRIRGKEMSWTEYHYPEDIFSWIDDLPNTIAPESGLTIEVTDIGTTLEGRPVKIAKVSSAAGGKGKQAVFIDAGIHAREWITPAVATYILNDLASNSPNNEDILERFDMYILPVLNPDGYSHSCNYNRLWRKSRRSTETLFDYVGCRGIDLNRNWGFTWGGRGSGSQPCSLIYAGEKAFSEPETAAVKDFVEGKKKENVEWISYFSLHSFGQKWMTPWGHTNSLPDDYNEMERVAKIGATELKYVHGTGYTVGSTNNVMYTASGSSADWFKGSVGVKYPYTLELRDFGLFGFLLPAYQILPTGEETWAGIKGALRAIP